MRISDWSSYVCSSDLVDLVRQARITRRIGRRHIVDPHRAAVGQHDPLPDDQCSLLPKCNDTVVASDQSRSLWDEQDAPGRTVEHLAGHLCRDKAGQVGTRSEEHTSELQSLMRNSYAVFCLKKQKKT